MVALEERNRLLERLHVLSMRRHQHPHEVFGVVIAVVAFDHDLRHVLVVKVADGALDEVAFLVDAGWRIGF